MKALKLTPIIAVVLSLFATTFAKAQTPVHCCTVIEVTDGYYTDKVWMITEPGTTDGFDNGWDGYKFLNTTAGIPQIFDRTADGDFQVSSFPTIENNSFGFIPGNASTYVLKFTHYDITYFYPGLYLIDMLTGDTIDVYANLSTYKFEASKTDMVDRFKFITKLPEKPVVVDPPVIVVPPVEEEVTPVDPGTDVNKKKKDGIDKKIKISTSRRLLKIENPNKVSAKIRIIDARTGRLVKEVIVNGGSTVNLDSEINNGQYVIDTGDNSSTTILIQ